MDPLNTPVIWMVVAFLVLTMLFFVVRSFKLPKSYFNNQKERDEIRQRLREKEYEEKHPKAVKSEEEE